MGLKIIPIKQKDAKAYIKEKHRHHKPPVGSVFQIACANEKGEIVGVIMVGRPVARKLDDGLTLEVNRLASDGTKNVCSMLYAAAWRVAKNLGYNRIITYILETETGISLKAAGWNRIGIRGGGSWNVPSRPRIDDAPICKKIMYEKCK